LSGRQKIGDAGAKFEEASVAEDQTIRWIEQGKGAGQAVHQLEQERLPGGMRLTGAAAHDVNQFGRPGALVPGVIAGSTGMDGLTRSLRQRHERPRRLARTGSRRFGTPLYMVGENG